MRILYHHRTLGDGAEAIHIREMVSAFRDLGHVVHVSGLAEGDAAPRAAVDRLRRLLPAAAFELASVASNLPDGLGVRRAIRDIRPDFLYKRHARFDVAALMAARRMGVPAVLEVNCLFTAEHYEQFEPHSLRRMAVRLERRALSLADVVLAVSTPLAAQIQQVAGVRAVVLPNGADPKRFDPDRSNGTRVRERFGLQEAFVVGWAGVMRDWHGLDLLLEVVAAIPYARLLVVGAGPARDAFEQRARDMQVAERIVITGRVPQEEMPEYLAAMDVAVVASDRTGVASPMKLVEYMAMRRAIVAPRQRNIEDLVTDGRSALLFDVDNPGDLRHAVSRLADDVSLRRSLGFEARRTVLQSRNWKANAQRVVELVGECVRDAAPRLSSGVRAPVQEK
jgi:glycosyltransferase involved in cell wall biosynthesis